MASADVYLDRPDLDPGTVRYRDLAGQFDGLVQVVAIEEIEPDQDLLGLGEGAVADHQLAFRSAQGCGCGAFRQLVGNDEAALRLAQILQVAVLSEQRLIVRFADVVQGIGGIVEEPGTQPSEGGWGLYVTVYSVHDTLARAESLGGQVVGAAFDAPGVGRMAQVADPDGATLSIIAYQPQA